MAANHTVDSAFGSRAGDDLFVLADEFDRVLDLVFQVGRQRPVGKPQLAPRDVEPQVQHQRRVVGVVAEEGQPLGVFDHPVELIAVDDKHPPVVGGRMNCVVADIDAAEMGAEVISQELVVIAGDVDDAGAVRTDTEALPIDVHGGVRTRRADRLRRRRPARPGVGEDVGQTIEQAGPVESTAGVYIQRVGLERAEATCLIRRMAINGLVPEPLRTAHIIVSGISELPSHKRV